MPSLAADWRFIHCTARFTGFRKICYHCEWISPLRESHEGENVMLTGAEVLAAGAAFLVAIWILVIFGSRFFGPVDH